MGLSESYLYEPSRQVLRELLCQHARVVGHRQMVDFIWKIHGRKNIPIANKSQARTTNVEPNVTELPPQLAHLADVQLMDAEAALQTIDILLLLVDHREFEPLAPQQGSRSIEVIDTRGLWRPRP